MPLIQFSKLGAFGRFGNQLFQYAFAKAYARNKNATLEVPAEWDGRKYFNITDPPLSRKLPLSLIDRPRNKVDIDLFGYFQYADALNLYSRADVKKWFKFKPEILEQHKPTKHKAVAHLRRTDYLTFKHIFCIVSKESYQKTLNRLGIPDPEVCWLIDGESQNHFLYDFLLMMNCDVLLRSNSTFSWWASTLGSAKTYSPLVEDKIGEQNVEFVEGNWPRIADSKNNPAHPTLITDLKLREI